MENLFNIKKFSTTDSNFAISFKNLLSPASNKEINNISKTVNEIISEVKDLGDDALKKYIKKFDKLNIDSVDSLEVPNEIVKNAYTKISKDQKKALDTAAKRIKTFHEKQKIEPFQYFDEYGSKISMQVLPIQKVGIYVPGGKAAYPSSVLMNTIPAKVAGVKEIIMVVPCSDDGINEMVLAAAFISGVDKIYKIGGAQAIAALAYGTETIPKVDKIVGPGNAYVAEAKRQVFGDVGIDMVAGPSEILIISDGSGNPDWITMDLFSQAEHDELAQSILLCTSKSFINLVQASISKLLPEMSREKIIKKSLGMRGALIHVENLEEACDLANQIAPEHLEIVVEDSDKCVKKITNAGSIFLGHFSSESLGDYCAGPNHVLPTSGSARFSSGLSVYDFKKRTSIINITSEGAKALGKVASVIARSETLTAHAKSAEIRYKN